jgi:hypothetical protein
MMLSHYSLAFKSENHFLCFYSSLCGQQLYSTKGAGAEIRDSRVPEYREPAHQKYEIESVTTRNSNAGQCGCKKRQEWRSQ